MFLSAKKSVLLYYVLISSMTESLLHESDHGLYTHKALLQLRVVFQILGRCVSQNLEKITLWTFTVATVTADSGNCSPQGSKQTKTHFPKL